MRIFFASCITAASKRQKQRIEQVQSLLHSSNHEVFNYVYELDRESTQSSMQLSEKILSCDVFIAEMSQPSQTLGFQMAFALNNLRPCLYLYDEETQGKPDAPLVGHPSRLLKIHAYSSNNLQHHLSSFLEYSLKQLNSKRTSFMSTREIDEYIDAESKRLGVPKAEIIRQVLHNAAKKTRP